MAVIVWPQWAWLGFAAAPLPLLCLAQCQIQLFQVQGAVMRMGLHVAGDVDRDPALAQRGRARRLRPDLRRARRVGADPAGRAARSCSTCSTAHAGFDWSGIRALTTRLLRRGMPITLANTILRLNYRVDVFVVAALLPLADVGKYSVAVAAGEVLWEVSRSLITGAYPRSPGRR